MEIKITPLSENAVIPQYQTEGAAGFDLHATENYTILPGSVALVNTDIAVELPDNSWEIQVRSRSGLAYKQMVFVLNAPGTVDSDFRDGIKVILANFGPRNFTVLKGDRIAQGVLTRVERAEFVVAESLTETDRGTGGFGSTGVSQN